MLDSPDAEEDIPIGEHPDIDVVDEDGVEVTELLVAEKRVWHPHLVWVGQGEVLQLPWE